jgi:hypothetical protein
MRIASLPKYLFPGLVLAVAVMISTSVTRAQAPSAKQQVIYLPDPTPRAPDLQLLLGDNPQAGTSTQEAVEHRNAKRRELVVWAANELVTLSERVQTDVVKPKTSESMASAAADADKIEQLAKNLTAALKAP